MFMVSVNVVSLLVSVHDRHGHLVNNLTADDFVLKEDGVPQHIRYFSKETDLPLTIGLLVDTSRSQTGVLEQERTASATFFDQILRQDKDQAFVAKFDDNVQILQPLTSSRTLLASSLNRLSIPEDYATLLYSAVRESSAKFMLNRPGRKAPHSAHGRCGVQRPGIHWFCNRVGSEGRHDPLFHPVFRPYSALPSRNRGDSRNNERARQGRVAPDSRGNRRSLLRGDKRSHHRIHLFRD